MPRQYSPHGVVLGERRGCGYRQRGGLYWESPIHHPLALPVDTVQLRLTHIGTRMIRRLGVAHILDWVSSEQYPTPEAFLAEARSMGISRRLASTVAVSALTPDSRLFIVHSHAVPLANGRMGPGIIASVPLSGLAVVDGPNASQTYRITRHAVPQNVPVHVTPL